MRFIKSLLALIAVLAIMLVACRKVDDLPFYSAGKAPVLTASTTTIAPTPADSNTIALRLSWTNPNYASDSSTFKYIIEIDSAGKNFGSAAAKIVSGTSSAQYTAKELNAILVNRGYAFNAPVDMDVRLISSYANNNERLTSNTIRIKITPYKVPPKIALPTTSKLFIVGAATQGGWNNPVPTPTQEFSRLDETTWAGVFQLTGGEQYLLLPDNGSWASKYAVPSNGVSGLSAGGDFAFYTSGGDNIPAPATSGMYKIIVDFQQGKFTVTPYTSTLPTNLFIVGNATPGGWNNPVPVPAQQLVRMNSSEWKVNLNFVASGEYLLLPVNGDWSNKYSVPNKTLAGLNAGGEFGYNMADNFPGPSAGTKTLTVNFAAKTTNASSSGRFTIQ